MDVVGSGQLHQERGDDIEEQNEGFWYGGTDEGESGTEDYYIEDVVDEAWLMVSAGTCKVQG